MLDFSEAHLSNLAIHQVGNKTNEDGIIISEKEVAVDGTIAALLTTYFTKPFKPQEFYNFGHETDLNLNEVYTYVKTIFNNKTSLHLQSINLARHLYEQSIYPQIKSGELYVAYFDNCYLNEELTEVVGIFKSEKKETFLKVFPEGKSFGISRDDGIDINKLDKGCLVFNQNTGEGFKVLLVDNTNKGEDARYWKDLFLNVKPQEDTFFHTKNYLQMCKSFATEAFPEADRIDQVSLVQESAKFFREEEIFDKLSFHQKVLQEPEIIEAFENYKDSYQQRTQMQVYDEFDINSDAVKKMNKAFKSVIKLDKNFHIYVHGNRNNIRKGHDEALHMNYYQLFYKEES
ncbi:MAG: nucleoid-associated protein [Cyclobacteriaceae bacterium]|nr:nucleoid-associated protein [Cyclobacteriaceae bacterium]